AFTGENKNLAAVRAITETAGIPCELGGGMRSEEAIARAFDAGASRIVTGTRAAGSVDFVEPMAPKLGTERIAVGIHARDGIVSVKGWTEASGIKAIDLALKVEAAGAGTIIYTDIATDGMLEGPNFAEMEHLLSRLKCQLIASGGVSKAEDVLRLNKMEGLYGVIMGKALYDQKIDLPALVAELKRRSEERRVGKGASS